MPGPSGVAIGSGNALPAAETPSCLQCGTPLEPSRTWQRYCSDSCRYKHWLATSDQAVGRRQNRKAPLQAPSDPGEKRPSFASAVLSRLRRGAATNFELAHVGGLRFGARVHDLRNAGHDIRKSKLPGGRWLYWLNGRETRED
jgi:hypothetical protein